jgi:hypothetical protein
MPIPTPEEIFNKVDVAYEYGIIRDQLNFDERIVLDTWYKNSLLLDEDVVDDDCYVSKSNIDGAGDGLFANRMFKKGETITEYPSTNIFIDGTIIGFHKGSCHKVHPTHETKKWTNKVKTGRIILYNIDELPKNQRFRGFKVNDNAYQPNIDKEGYTNNLHKNNATFDELFNIVATEDIYIGAEIYVGYGFAYWTSWGVVSQTKS